MNASAVVADLVDLRVAERFLQLFVPAAHAHGTYELDGNRGKDGKLTGSARTIPGAVTPEAVQRHLAGEQRLGFVPIHEDGRCRFGAIDIDKYRGHFDTERLKRLARKVARCELPLVVCGSKSGGVHLYAFFAEWQSAEELRAQLCDWAAQLGYGGVEIFPKQSDLSGGQGNWINAPYYGAACHAIDEDGRELAIEDFLARAEALSRRKPAAAAEPGEFDLDAAADILAEHWTHDRHQLALTAAGALLRQGVAEERVRELIEAVAEITQDEEPAERRQCVETARRALEQDRRMYGLPELRRRLEKDTDRFLAACGVEGRSDTVTLDDFRAHLPGHDYIYLPTGALWPAASVDSQLRPVPQPSGKKIRASTWLDRHRPVHQMTWAPGEPQIIPDKLVAGGGWIEREGQAVFNLYRPPNPMTGDPRRARRWLRAMCRVWPHYARRHIISYLAHRVQRPAEKINHALVLGGEPGIGKDTLLEPLKYGVGHRNFTEINPAQLLGRFNGFVKSVVLRVNEARDLGDVNRFGLYEHMKTLTAAPPDVLRCDEKNLREHDVFNVCGVIVTTNHKEDGIYLPPDDRRHFVAWSERTQEEFREGYWSAMWAWYAAGGIADVVAWLAQYDLSDWNPKAPPPKTEAFWAIVDANRAPEDSEFSDVLEAMGNPDAVTLEELRRTAMSMASGGEESALARLLTDPKARRQIPHRLNTAGYVPVRNPNAPKDGLWKQTTLGVVFHGQATEPQTKRVVIYAKKGLSPRDRLVAAERVSAVKLPARGI